MEECTDEWEHIECGFNTADETINFGTRNFAGIDNLYEACTLAAIKSTKEGVREKPNIRAVIKNGLIFFSIDKTMKVFSDLLCSDLSFNATFDNEIDAFCVTSDGKYFLLCLQNGAIYCFEMENGGVIYTEKILENNTAEESFFVDAFVENESIMPSFLVVLRNGKVYRITASESSSRNEESQSQLFNFTHHLVTDLDSRIRLTGFLNPLLIMVNEATFIIYNVQTNEIDCSDICQLKRILLHNRMVLGLDYNGRLINICTKTLLTYTAVIDTAFDDILLINGNGISHILGITKKDEFGISYLQLLTYPKYSVLFSLKVSDAVHLITPEHTHDEIIFVSEIKHQENVNELRFQVVSETSPENRLRRLLRKQKFEEAEQCAKLFQLDLSEIQKAKAQVIVDKSICKESDIDTLLKILNTIEDDSFKIQSCLGSHGCCSNLKDVERILNYGYSLSPQLDQIICKEICDQISKVMFRFNTFMALVRCSGKKYNVQEWNDFSECCLINELCITLEHNRIEESVIIYNRLDSDSILDLNEADVHIILDVLSNISIEDVLPFLITFIPLTLSYLPSSLDLLVKWVVEKVFQTEKKCAKEFPENAIKFLKKMVQILKVESSATFNFQQKYLAHLKSLPQLTGILEALEQLQSLKNDYRIIVPLQQFLQPKEILIETLLLNRGIDIVGNENLVEEFIQKFIRNYELEPDIILTNVVKDITTYAEECWIKVVPVILNSIGSIKLKLEATLITLKAANVPWCVTIREIANKSIQYSHPIVKEIIHEIEYEPKCVIFNKYPGLNNRYINSIEDLKHAMSRIVHCNRPTIIKDLYQVCIDSREKHEANIILILHYIKTGEFTKALQILNNNSQEEVVKCCKHLQVFVTVTMNKHEGINHLQENCYEILGTVFNKLQENCEENEKFSYLQCLNSLRGVYKIRKHFSLKITTEDLENLKKKNDVLENLILITVEEFQGKKDLSSCTENCDKISAYLGIDKNIILFRLCERVGDFNVILQAAKKMYLSDADARSLCQIVSLILKCLGSPEAPNNNQKFVLQNIVNVDLTIFVRGLQLAGKIVVKAILKSNANEIGNCMELANWVHTTYSMMQDDKKHSPLFVTNSYRGDLILPSIASLNSIRDFFLSYRKMIGPIPQPHLNIEYSQYMDGTNSKLHPDAIIIEMESLQTKVTCLCTEGHSFTAYKLLHTLQNGLVTNSCISENLRKSLNEMLDRCTKQLLQNVFAAPHIDADLAYGLILSCSPKYSNNFLFNSLKTYKRIAQKFKTIAQIFLRFLQHNGIEEHQRLCINIIYLFKWWNKIKTCQIPYDHFFKKSPTEVIKKLITLNDLNIDSVKEFCFDFKIDENVYYDFYLKNLLLNWKGDYTVQQNIDGKEVLIVKNDEHQLKQNCMEVINVIKDKESVCEMLNRTWDSINFYHYEVFICVLNILSILNTDTESNQKHHVLLFLKNYNRTSPPGKTEEEEWFTLYPKTQSIESLSKWRLPFTPTLFTNKIWSIIRPEINLKTYTKWFEAISILKKNLNKDDICSYVIKDIVSSGVFRQTSNEWVLHARHNDLLAEIDACIQNMSNLEQATSAVYFLTTSIPGGADQVNAITLCYKYAQEYQKKSPQAEDVMKAVIKVRNKYFSFSTAHILYSNQLADKQYLAMISGPVDELIEALYMDERITRKATFVIASCPDINNTVNQLAALHNLDIQVKRKQLLNCFLSPHTVTPTFSMDTSTFMANTEHSSNLDHSDNLIRASYLCTSDDVSMWRAHLLQLGNINPADTRNLNYKANALKCFCNISDIETIEKLTNVDCDTFIHTINKLTLISCLECFGFFLNIESLNEYNKIELLNRLSYNITNPIGVNAMALVCTVYEIHEAIYWSAIINAMLKLNMDRELKECVIFLKKCDIFLNKKFYIDAWQAVINNSFNFTTKEDVNNVLKKNFYMIQSCPVVFALDLEDVVKKCLQFKKHDFAALAVQYLSKTNQTVYFKEILKADQDIHKKIDELALQGLWGTSYIRKLMEQAHQEVASA